LPFSYLWAFKH